MLSVHTSPLDQPGTGDAGGMNVYVLELAKALADRGSRVEIFTRATSSAQPDVVAIPGSDERGRPLREDAARAVLRADEVPAGIVPPVLVHHVPSGPYERLAKEDLPGVLCGVAAGVLRAEASRPRGWFHAIHSHYWLSGQVGLVAADRWDVPLVHTAHTLARVKNAALAPGDVAEPAARVAGEEQVVEAADALVASTPAEARQLVELYGADPARVHIVEPGVDLDRFRPGGPGAREEARATLGLPPEGQIVLFAGRVQPLKAPDVLVRALGVLRATGRPVPVLVVLGGPSGRQGAVRDLQTLARDLGVEERLRVHPPAARTDLVRWYHAADLVAMPSRTESFGLVAAEAQASGLPVVAAAVGGLRTIVDDGVSGRLVRGHDPVVWADVLADALSDEEMLAAWAKAARPAAERFGWDSAADQVLKVYRLAAEARRAR